MFFDYQFWQNFLSNALATLIGVVAGIPVALWISKIQESSSEKERKKKILGLIKKELFTNQLQLIHWQESKNKLDEALILNTQLRNESWLSFSDGGELEWIKNPGLLDNIAEAYYSIRSIMELSEKYFDAIMLGNEKTSENTKQSLLDVLNHGVVYSLETISQALKILDKEII